jgi:sugar/nucleoside kinase (ribokinase family)
VSNAPLVVVVGDVGLDVVARPEGAIAAGSDTHAQVRLTPGGAGANTAEWLVASGARALLMGRIGADAAGRQVHDGLVRTGVECVLAVDPEAPTCCVVVIVDAHGGRTMLDDRGASARLVAADIDAAALDGAAHLHLSGYVLLSPASRPAGIFALAAARTAGLTTSVDPQSAAQITDPECFLADVSGVDVLLPNADELRVLTGSDDLAAADKLLEWVGAVAFTDGPRGATWVDRSGSVNVSAVPATYVDPTGCGDAFDAGLLATWLRGSGLQAALGAGVAAGARAVSVLGARPA